MGIFEENQFSLRYYGKIWESFFTILVIFRLLCEKKEKYKIFYRFLDHLICLFDISIAYKDI